jgi:hypothetical protein
MGLSAVQERASHGCGHLTPSRVSHALGPVTAVPITVLAQRYEPGGIPDDDGELSGASTVLAATAPLGPGLRAPVALDFAEEWR